jgi:hypothetical protein
MCICMPNTQGTDRSLTFITRLMLALIRKTKLYMTDRVHWAVRPEGEETAEHQACSTIYEISTVNLPRSHVNQNRM